MTDTVHDLGKVFCNAYHLSQRPGDEKAGYWSGWWLAHDFMQWHGRILTVQAVPGL